MVLCFDFNSLTCFDKILQKLLCARQFYQEVLLPNILIFDSNDTSSFDNIYKIAPTKLINLYMT